MAEASSDEPDADSPARRRRPLFLIGILLCILGPALYFGQVYLRHLWTPWYIPMLATLGLVLMLVSARERRSVLRGVALLPFLLLCGLEWYVLLVASRTPEYAGPARPGAKLPAFTAALSDGQALTNRDLAEGQPTALVFFRGRW